MKRLIVAEKPSVGRDLARALGLKAKADRAGLIEGPNLVVTWCIGHLVELAEPHEYRAEWRRWSRQTLPMLPDTFKTRPIASARDQWQIVSRALVRTDVNEVINACDAGREGELIFRMAYELSGSTKPVQRLWISSLTTDAILEGFRELRPSSELDDLGAAARCRAQADWLVGINATRGATVLARTGAPGAGLLSVGRVQTPTLAMIAERDQAIETFVPQDYFELWADFEPIASKKGEGDNRYRGRWIGPTDETRFQTLEAARQVEAAVANQPGILESVNERTIEEKPPQLFDLTSLQRTANRAFGFSAAKTLSVTQALYEKHKLVTYPRTDSRFLTPDLVPSLRSRIQALDLEPWSHFARPLLERRDLTGIGRIVQAAKVRDHHAIIPTSAIPRLDALSSDERRVYDLIARRFLGAFHPPARFRDIVAITRVDTPRGPAPVERFRSHGKALLEEGWRAVAGFGRRDANASGDIADGVDEESGGARSTRSSSRGPKARDGDDSDSATAGVEVLGRLREGQAVRVVATGVDEKQTRPPERFNDASLLSAMEGAGKAIEDEALRRAMKDNGLGTPATRASIIETLLDRGYIRREKKSLHVTEAGVGLLSVLEVPELKSPELTGRWEARLARMARGEESSQRFMDEIRQFVIQITEKILHAKPPEPTRQVVGNCPRCGSEVVVGRSFYECESAREGACRVRIPRMIAGQLISTALAAELLRRGKTGWTTGFRSKAGKRFGAVLVLDPDGGVKFDFDQAARPSSRRPAGRGQAGRAATTGPGAPSGGGHRRRRRKAGSGHSAPGIKKGTGHRARPLDGESTPRPSRDLEAESTPLLRGGSNDGRADSRNSKRKPTNRGRPDSIDPEARPRRDAGIRPAPSPEPVLRAAAKPMPSDPSNELGVACPHCKQGRMITGRRGWGCSRWKEGCAFVLWFQMAGKRLTVAQARQLLVQGRTPRPLAGFRDEDGQPFRARIVLLPEVGSSPPVAALVPEKASSDFDTKSV